MSSGFQSEMKSWKEVLRLRKATIFFFVVVLSLVTGLFFLLVQQYQTFATQISRLTGELELVVEIDPSLSSEQLQSMQEEIRQLPAVKQVEYWSQERAAEYIDQQMLPGYLDFLNKTQLEIPVNPLLRIQLSELQKKAEVEKFLAERYTQFIITTDSLLDRSGQTFAQQFIAQLQDLSFALRHLSVWVLVLLFALSGYFTAFVLAERSRGFHLSQFLHLSPPYEFFSALILVFIFSFATVFLGLLWGFILGGQWLFVLALQLFVALGILDILLVWAGRFVLARWSLK